MPKSENQPDALTAKVAGTVELGRSGSRAYAAAVTAGLTPVSNHDRARLGWRDVVSDRYLLLILLVAGLNVVAFYDLNYSYMSCVERRFEDTRDCRLF